MEVSRKRMIPWMTGISRPEAASKTVSCAMRTVFWSQTGSPQEVCSRYSTVTCLKPEWKRSSSFDAVSTMR